MSKLDQLRGMEQVGCTLCMENFPGSAIDEHDASAGHRRRKGDLFLTKAITRVTGWACPGLCYPPAGRPGIDG